MFGVNLYVVGAIAVLLLGLTGASYALYERGNAAASRADAAEALVSQYKADLAESEANNARLRDLQKQLDAAVKVREQRAADLRKALGELDAQYEQLEKSLAAEDQSCLHRELPAALAERLRDPADGHKDGSPANPGSATDAVR